MESGGKDIVTTAVMDADHFQLSHKDNSFSIEFSAMEFFSPGNELPIYIALTIQVGLVCNNGITEYHSAT